MMRRQYGYYFYLKIKNSKHGEVGTVLSRFRLRPTKSPQSIFHPCEFLLPSSVHSYTKQSIYRLIYHPCKFLLPSSFSSRYYYRSIILYLRRISHYQFHVFYFQVSKSHIQYLLQNEYDFRLYHNMTEIAVVAIPTKIVLD